MSGKAVSKHTIGPIRSPCPTFITTCREPFLRSSPAAFPPPLRGPLPAALARRFADGGRPAEQRARRDVLAEGDEPHLVVAFTGETVRPDEHRALVDAGLVGAPGVHVDQDVGARLTG